MRLVSSEEVLVKFEKDYDTCTIRYGDMKKQLGEDMVNFITPLRKKAAAIHQNEKYLAEAMEKGAGKARKSARETILLVRDAVGLKYY